MDVIGLGGPPGSGKSAVAQRLAQRDGVEWLDLDRVAWSTYRPGSPAHAKLVERFGPGILADGQRIDRSRLADLAFADAESRRALDAIVHPPVSRALAFGIARLATRGTAVLLVEGALLGVSAHVDYDLFDALLWFEASSETRRRRLAADRREHHAERWGDVHPAHGTLRIDAERPVDQVAESVWAVIERARSAGSSLTRDLDPPTSG